MFGFTKVPGQCYLKKGFNDVATIGIGVVGDWGFVVGFEVCAV